MPQAQESLALRVYSLFFESSYRTGKYWDNLTKALGVGEKQKITSDDVLTARKNWTQKPKSKKRDSVLRDLDKAMKYFTRKLKREMGTDVGNRFREKYKEIGNLNPSDYNDKEQTFDLKSQSEVEPDSDKNPSLDLDFSEIFSSKEDDEEVDYYEDFKTKE